MRVFQNFTGSSVKAENSKSPMSSSILHHVRNYTSAGFLAALGGVLSFPILTRNLSIEDYGLLGLVTSSIALAVALGKLGIQHSIIRFFAQVVNQDHNWSVKELYSTVFIIFILLASILTFFWILAGTIVFPAYMESEQITELYLIASGVVFLRLIGSGIVNFLRAKQLSGVLGISQVLHKYLHLLMIVAALYFANLSAAIVIFFLLVAEAVTVLYVGRALWPSISLQWSAYSRSLAKALVIYGLPLMAYESLSLVLRLSDRYIIEALLGAGALGQYSASYNLTAYLDLIILAGIVQAVRPMYTHLWEADGKQPTQAFLEKSFRLYVVIGIPLILSFSLVAPDLLVILSGEKYHDGTVIIPYVALSFFLEGAVLFLGAGLHIGKNTRIFLQWAMLAALLNIVLNILLIPYFGLIGASVMTIVSYLVFLLGVSFKSFTLLRFTIDVKRLLYISVLSVLVYAALIQIELHSQVFSMLIKGTLASLIYCTLLVLFDTDIRVFITQRLRGIGMRGRLL